MQSLLIFLFVLYLDSTFILALAIVLPTPFTFRLFHALLTFRLVKAIARGKTIIYSPVAASNA